MTAILPGAGPQSGSVRTAASTEEGNDEDIIATLADALGEAEEEDAEEEDGETEDEVVMAAELHTWQRQQAQATPKVREGAPNKMVSRASPLPPCMNCFPILDLPGM